LIEPQVGELASGLMGPGRMEEPEKILEIIKSVLLTKNELSGKKVMVTAGPTYEAIDPVRFIGNHSSGLMGVALAEEAASRGAEVTLVCGPSQHCVQSNSISRIDVTSASEMQKACLSVFPGSDITIMAAAVSDYTIENPALRKIKKTGTNISLELSPTADILKELGNLKKRNQILIGFALETDHGMVNAKEKLDKKNLDIIVLNSLNDKGAGFKSPTNKITLIFKDGKEKKYPVKSKREVAGDILDAIHELK
jgi:phosphopantothenoylcysteine decarboxylase / phosphopantothenate---cysteine ligase